jgi:hypothetical protein
MMSSATRASFTKRGDNEEDVDDDVRDVERITREIDGSCNKRHSRHLIVMTSPYCCHPMVEYQNSSSSFCQTKIIHTTRNVTWKYGARGNRAIR